LTQRLELIFYVTTCSYIQYLLFPFYFRNLIEVAINYRYIFFSVRQE